MCICNLAAVFAITWICHGAKLMYLIHRGGGGRAGATVPLGPDHPWSCVCSVWPWWNLSSRSTYFSKMSPCRLSSLQESPVLPPLVRRSLKGRRWGPFSGGKPALSSHVCLTSKGDPSFPAWKPGSASDWILSPFFFFKQMELLWSSFHNCWCW